MGLGPCFVESMKYIPSFQLHWGTVLGLGLCFIDCAKYIQASSWAWVHLSVWIPDQYIQQWQTYKIPTAKLCHGDLCFQQILQNLVEGLQLQLTGALPQGVQLAGIETGAGGNLLPQTVQIDASLLQQLQQQGNINITINPQLITTQQVQAPAAAPPAAADPNLVQVRWDVGDDDDDDVVDNDAGPG